MKDVDTRSGTEIPLRTGHVVFAIAMALFVISSVPAIAGNHTSDDDVKVEQKLEVSAPADNTSSGGDSVHKHNEKDVNQKFEKGSSDEVWTIKSNNPGGASVQFSWNQFSTTVNSTTYSRAAKVNFQVTTNNANWSFNSNTATASGSGASVTVSSGNPGSAKIDVDITFVEDNTTDIAPEGTYSTTITGTFTSP